MLRLLLLLAITVVCGLGAPQAHAQIEALPRPDTIEAASFGISVAIEDSIAVVGASSANVCGEDAGAVFVYEQHPGPPVTSWELAARLVPGECRPGSFFGADVALSGSRILVSAFSEQFAGRGRNAGYVFERADDGEWTQTARLTRGRHPDEGLFGAGVALDGDRAVVSTSGDADGEYHGALYVFEHDVERGSWQRSARVTSTRNLSRGVLGGDVALSGNQMAVAASTYFRHEPGSIYIFRFDPGAQKWRTDAHIRDIDAFFIDLDLSDGAFIVGENRAGDDGSGKATLYTRRDRTWSRSTTLKPSVPYESGAFGSAVTIDGTRALVTGYDEQLGKETNIDRVVYVFHRRKNGSWRQQTILDVGQVDFGTALDLDGRMALVSSVPESETGTTYVTRLP